PKKPLRFDLTARAGSVHVSHGRIMSIVRQTRAKKTEVSIPRMTPMSAYRGGGAVTYTATAAPGSAPMRIIDSAPTSLPKKYSRPDKGSDLSTQSRFPSREKAVAGMIETPVAAANHPHNRIAPTSGFARAES